jgi:hypothetical protein
MLGSARWLKPHTVCHVAASGLHLSGEQEYMQTGPEPTRLGPDTCQHRTPAWALFKARVCSVLELWDSIAGGSDPIRGGVWIPFQGSGLHTWRSWTKLGGPDCISRGLVLSLEGPDSLLMSWSISPSLDTWRLWTRPCGGVRHCCGPRVVARGWGESWSGPIYRSFTTRPRIATWVLCLYTTVRVPLF